MTKRMVGGAMRAALLFSLIISSSVLSTSVGRGSYPSQGSPLSPASNPLPFPLRASAAFSSKPARHSPLREFQVDDGENEKKRPRDQSPDVRSRHLRVSPLPSSSPAANGTSHAQAQQAQASAALAAAAPNPHPGRNSSHAGAAVAQGNEAPDVMRSSAGLTLADVRRHMQHARRPALNRANMSGSEAGDGGDGGSSMPLSPKSRISQDTTPDTCENDCPICAEDMTAPEQLIGRIDCNSTHVFCFTCIHRWGTECENSCPLCKRTFNRIEKLIPAPITVMGKKLNGERDGCGSGEVEFVAGLRRVLSTVVQVEEKRQVAEDEGVPEEGEGCMDCGRGGLMVVCDGCELGCCLDCANMTEQTLPPEEEPWYCHACDEEEDDDDGAAGGRAGRRNAEQRAIAEARALGRSYRPRRRRRGLRTTLDGFIVGRNTDDDEEWAPSSSAERSPLPDRPRRSTCDYGIEPDEELQVMTRSRRRSTNATVDFELPDFEEALAPEVRRALEEGRAGVARRTRVVSRPRRASCGSTSRPSHHVYLNSAPGPRRVGLSRPRSRRARRPRRRMGSDASGEEEDSDFEPSRDASPAMSVDEITLSEEEDEDGDEDDYEDE